MPQKRLSLFAMILLFIFSLTIISLAQEDSYPVISKDNASAIQEIGVMGGDQGRIAVSSDDHWLAVAGNQGVWLIDLTVPDSSPVLLKGHTEAVNAVDFSPDSSLLASASDDNTIRLWSLPDGKTVKVLEGHSDDVRDIDFDKQGVALASASGGTDNTVRIWSVESGEQLREYTDIPKGYSRVEFLNTVAYLLAGTNNSSLAAWSLDDDRFIAEINSGFNSNVTSVAASPNESKIAIGLFSGRVIFGDLEANTQSNLEYNDKGVNDVAFSPNGKLLATVSMDDKLVLIDTATGDKLNEFERDDYLYSVAFGSDSSVVYAVSHDGMVTAWDTNSGEVLREIPLAFPTVRQIAYSPDGKFIAAVTDNDHLARVFDAQTLEQIAVLSGHSGRTFGLAFSPDGSLLATAGGSTDPIFLWDTATWEKLDTIPNEEKSLYSLAFSPDGSVLASGGEKTIHLYDVLTHEEVATLDNGETVWSIAFSPDGSLLAVPAGVWDLSKGEKLDTKIDKYAGVSFSPLGDIMATSDGIMPAPIASTATAPIGFTGLNNTYVAFSPDGSLVAIAKDEQIQIVDVNLQNVVTTLQSPAGNVRSIAFSPDGTRLISGGYDALIHVWAVNSDAPATPAETAPISTDGMVLDFIPEVADTAISDTAITLDTAERLSRLVIRQAVGDIGNISLSPDGKHAILSGKDGAFLIDLSDPTVQPIRLKARNTSITASALTAKFSNSGGIVAVSHGYADDKFNSGSGISFWDVSIPRPRELRSVAIDNDKVFSLAFSHDDQLLAMGFQSKQAKVYDTLKDEFTTTTQDELFGVVNGIQFDAQDSVLSLSDTAGNKALFGLDGKMIGGFNSAIAYPMLFAPKNAFLYSAEQKSFVLRNGSSGEVIQENPYPDSMQGDIKTTDVTNGQLIVASDNTIWFLDYQTGEISQTITGFSGGIISAEASADGSQLVGVTGDNILHIWDIADGKEVSQRSFGYNNILASMDISSDGGYVALENKDVSIMIFDVLSGDKVKEIKTPLTSSFHFVPGTHLLATVKFKEKIEFWDVDSGEMIQSVPFKDQWIRYFSNNADYMLSTNGDQVTLQNIRTGAVPFKDAQLHLGTILDVDILPSAGLMVTGGDDGIAKIWNIKNGQPVGLIRSNASRVDQVAFSPSDPYIATMADDGITVWDYSDLADIKQLYHFDLSPVLDKELYFSVDGSLLMAHIFQTMTVWSMADGTELGEIDIPDGTSRMSLDGGLIVATDDMGSIVAYLLNS